MSLVIDFPRASPKKDTRKLHTFKNGKQVYEPRTAEEYLGVCKNVLTEGDYRELLCAIMDIDYYSEAESALQLVVDCYRNFGE